LTGNHVLPYHRAGQEPRIELKKMLSIKKRIQEIIQILGVSFFALGLMLLPRAIPRQQPLLGESGFTRMKDAGAFEDAGKMLLVTGPVVFLISFIPISRSGGKPSSKNLKK